MKHTLFLLFALLLAPLAQAQAQPAEVQGSRNVNVVGQLGLDALGGTPGAVVLDPAPDRPLAYVARTASDGAGFAIIDLAGDTPTRHYRWSLGEPGVVVADLALIHRDSRAWLVVALQQPSAPTANQPAALFFDVTQPGAPIESTALIQAKGGFRDLFAYRHPDGRALLFATGGNDVLAYDLDTVLAGAAAPIAVVSTPEQLEVETTGFEDLYVALHAETEQDRLYAAGAGGYYVYDVTDLAAPALLATVNVAAVTRGQAVATTPDGRHLVAGAGYRTAPLRLFDLQPVLDGTIPRARTAVGAWVADWRNFAHAFEVRWPFLFVAAMEDGFQVVNILDPAQPYTDAFYHTTRRAPSPPNHPELYGAFDVAVRNHDGLIAVSDLDTGLWFFRLDGFQGWDGRDWGLPNLSSEQDWLHGPSGADRW